MVDMIKTVGANPCVRPLDGKEIQILLSQGQTHVSALLNVLTALWNVSTLLNPYVFGIRVGC